MPVSRKFTMLSGTPDSSRQQTRTSLSELERSVLGSRGRCRDSTCRAAWSGQGTEQVEAGGPWRNLGVSPARAHGYLVDGVHHGSLEAMFMYSVVLMVAMAGGAETPALFNNSCHGCCGYSCSGYSYSCSGCCGYSSCHGCRGFSLFGGKGCHGC